MIFESCDIIYVRGMIRKPSPHPRPDRFDFIVQFPISNTLFHSNSLNDFMSPNSSLNFTANNFKGIQSSKKTLGLIQYLKDKIGVTEVLFLLEIKLSKIRKRTFEDKYFFLTKKRTHVAS